MPYCQYCYKLHAESHKCNEHMVQRDQPYPLTLPIPRPIMDIMNAQLQQEHEEMWTQQRSRRTEEKDEAQNQHDQERAAKRLASDTSPATEDQGVEDTQMNNDTSDHVDTPPRPQVTLRFASSQRDITVEVQRQGDIRLSPNAAHRASSGQPAGSTDCARTARQRSQYPSPSPNDDWTP